MIVISMSRRTDIPAWFSPWLVQRFREGLVYVRNPFSYHQVSSIDLNSSVDGIVLWTRDIRPLMEHLDIFGDIPWYVQYTVTGYGRTLEPQVPALEQQIESVIELSRRIGPDRVIWRYDPILCSREFDADFHEQAFSYIAGRLEGYVKKCMISFYDEYACSRSRMRAFELERTDPFRYAQLLSVHAEKHGLSVRTCAEEYDLSAFGILPGSCIDGELLQSLGVKDLVLRKDRNQRKACRCIPSVDIGVYSTCRSGCLYCYACRSRKPVDHDSSSPLLVGHTSEDDRILPRH